VLLAGGQLVRVLEYELEPRGGVHPRQEHDLAENEAVWARAERLRRESHRDNVFVTDDR
jgi:hypothetical protein